MLHVSTDDNSGGASRSAYRLHQALTESAVDSWMRVLRHETSNSRILEGKSPRTFQKKIIDKLLKQRSDFSARNWSTENPIMHSFGNVSAGVVDEINNDAAQIVNLHWVSELLSIEDIGAISKPIVWTVHDMWTFCGGEHSTPDEQNARFREGYFSYNRPQTERGPDLNRIAWERKKRVWLNKPFNFVAPSRWIADCIKGSALFSSNVSIAINVIPNPLDVENIWRPIDKAYARASLGLSNEKKYVLAGSAGGMSTIKGEDMLIPIMQKLADRHGEHLELIVFGRKNAHAHETWPVKVHWMGRVVSDTTMVALYNAADVMMVPSRQDNLPNTAVEAQACGTPVVGFDIGGLPDIIEHQNTGWIASPFDLEDFVYGVTWSIDDKFRQRQLMECARRSAYRKYHAKTIANSYNKLYQQVLSQRSDDVSKKR